MEQLYRREDIYQWRKTGNRQFWRLAAEETPGPRGNGSPGGGAPGDDHKRKSPFERVAYDFCDIRTRKTILRLFKRCF